MRAKISPHSQQIRSQEKKKMSTFEVGNYFLNEFRNFCCGLRGDWKLGRKAEVGVDVLQRRATINTYCTATCYCRQSRGYRDLMSGKSKQILNTCHAGISTGSEDEMGPRCLSSTAVQTINMWQTLAITILYTAELDRFLTDFRQIRSRNFDRPPY